MEEDHAEVYGSEVTDLVREYRAAYATLGGTPRLSLLRQPLN
jgi:hypothetical protein